MAEADEKATSDVKTVEEILKSEGNDELKFGLLIGLIKVNQASNKDVVNTVLHLLVGGEFDIESNFVIQDSLNIPHMLEVVTQCPDTLKAEIWSVFMAMLKKSRRNLQACTEVGLISHVLDMLQDTSNMVADLLVDMLGTLAAYSITVKELKSLFRFLKSSDGEWPRHSVKLISVMKQMPQRQGPDEFFSFPGKKGSLLQLPPIKTWPYQSGWTFSCWLRLDPVTGVTVERERPYLYCFHTNKGVGYSANFLGNSLVITSMKVKGKGFQHCVKYEFQPRKWYMLSIVHVYNRWSKSEIRCYVDGQMASGTDMSWLVSTSDPFDKCYIGGSSEGDVDHMFCGQLSAVYLFGEALSTQQITAVHELGPSYKSQFRFPNESQVKLTEVAQRLLYDGKLTSIIVFMYNPIACDGQLCLESSPKGNISNFLHSPHAMMQGEVKAVITHSVHSTLHSLGGIQILFPLFGQLDLPVKRGEKNPSVVDNSTWNEDLVNVIFANLLGLLYNLIQSSSTIQQQMVQNKGFLVIGHLLEKSSRDHITPAVLEVFLNLTNFLVKLPTGATLLKHLFDHILFNPALWIHSSMEVQTKLYCYLATDFINDAQIYNSIRRVSAVLQTMHTLKFYYWVVNPCDRSGIVPKGTEGPRPDFDEIIKLRSFMLLYIKQLLLKGQGVQDDELQSMLNYLCTLHEDVNLIDVLELLVNLMAEHPASMVPAFDGKQGIRTVFKLLASPNEDIRIRSLKLFGFWLMRSTPKRKQDALSNHNLFSLLGERLLLNDQKITMKTYNALFEMLTERMTLESHKNKHEEPEGFFKIENSAILKVVATMIRQSKLDPEIMTVKKTFLSDLTILCRNNKENRRTVLQMSVWQDWLFSMAYVYPQNQEQHKVTEMVMSLFRMLLHHAIKFEYGGWRVWIDTLAILHSKVAYEDFKLHMAKMYKQYDLQRVDDFADAEERSQHPISTISGVSDAEINKPIPKSTVKVTEIPDGESTNQNATSDSSASGLDNGTEAGNQNEAGAQGGQTNGVNAVNGVESKENGHGEVEYAEVGKRKVPTRTESMRSGHRMFTAGPRAPPFRIPEFRWSYLHQKLLSDLLFSVETDVQVWKSHTTKTVIDFVNSGENSIYVVNVTHMISQLADNLITSCGGLLPLLAAATSSNGEVEILEPTQGLSIEQAVSILLRIMNLTDILVFASSTNFAELEQEKNMPAGGILRQCLRLVCTAAVRNSLEVRHRQVPPTPPTPTGTSHPLAALHRMDSKNQNGATDPIQALIEGSHPTQKNIVENLNEQISPIKDPDKLLQDMDINRLRAVVYRDVEETKQAQFLALAIVYFTSVLMVSKYRDILEPPSPAQTPNQQQQARRNSTSQSPSAAKYWHNLRPSMSLLVDGTTIENIKVNNTEDNPTTILKPMENFKQNVKRQKSDDAKEKPTIAVVENSAAASLLSQMITGSEDLNMADLNESGSGKKGTGEEVSVNAETTEPVGKQNEIDNESLKSIKEEINSENIDEADKQSEKNTNSENLSEKVNHAENQSENVNEKDSQSGKVKENDNQSGKVNEKDAQSEKVNHAENQSENVNEKDSQSEKVKENDNQSGKVNEKDNQSEKVNENDKSEQINEKDNQSEKVNEKDNQSEKVNEKDNQSEKVIENDKQSEKVNEKDNQSKKINENDKQTEKVNEKDNQSEKVNENDKVSVKGIETENKSEKIEEAKNKPENVEDKQSENVDKDGSQSGLVANSNDKGDNKVTTGGEESETGSSEKTESEEQTGDESEADEEESESQSGTGDETGTGESQAQEDADSSVDESQIKLKIQADVNVSADTEAQSPGRETGDGEESEEEEKSKADADKTEDDKADDDKAEDDKTEDDKAEEDQQSGESDKVENGDKAEEEKPEAEAEGEIKTEEKKLEAEAEGEAEVKAEVKAEADDNTEASEDKDEDKKPEDGEETAKPSAVAEEKSEAEGQQEEEPKQDAEGKVEETTDNEGKEKPKDDTDKAEDQKDTKVEQEGSGDVADGKEEVKKEEEVKQETAATSEASADDKAPAEQKVETKSDATTEPDGAVKETEEKDKDKDQIKTIAAGGDPMPISSISGTHKPNDASASDHNTNKPEKLELKTPMPGPVNLSGLESGNLTERLEKALGSVAPLLREIFVDFAPYLSKTLIGSHGQELLIGGLVTLKQSTSVVELVMLLCSQEWQNSLQKHAGLAFIELVNEGRLLAHATRDHIVRVANEADFILNRMRAEDVQKHAEFESLCAQMMLDRREEEKLCDHLITSAKRRDYALAIKIRDKVVNILTNKHGTWGDPAQKDVEFWKLDVWEDDSRRRRRFIRNPHGSTHPEATLKAAIEHGATEDAINQAREAFHAYLADKKAQTQQPDYTDEELLMEENEFEREYSGPVAMSTPCKLIAPGVAINGLMSITKTDLYFEMDEDDAENKTIDQQVLAYIEYLHGKWNFNEIRAIFSRRFLLQNVAIEIFLANRTAVMFAFPDHATVKKVINALPRVGVGVKYGLSQARRMSQASGKQLYKMSTMTQKWQRREISNYDYLMYLNTIAGRTYNDLNQYPVFPWVIVNYDSDELDLSQPSNFRDLSKPIGALNPSRKEFFEERYNSWEHDQIPPFHYGTHYSTAAFVLNWLIRVEPFTTQFLNLQGGKFDHADRIFFSVSQAWKNCQRDTSDVKELIPEFYAVPEMFMNCNKFNYGKQDDGAVVDDVILPKWSRSPEDFVRINRMALESEFVSCQLHHWIDLIFGYKQRGPEAVRATNVFYYLTYEGNANLENMSDPVMREAIENQIRSFGQTPTQLLTEPHPPRSSVMHLSPMMFTSVQDDVCMIMKFLSNSPVCHVAANTHPAVPCPSVTTITCNHNFALNKWNPNYQHQGTPTSFQSGENKDNKDAPPNLPLAMDTLLVTNTGLQRRTLGDNFDQRLKVTHSHFMTTADNRFIFACGFWDKSFRLYSSDTGKILQVVYGHFDVVTCITRSECNLNQDCYIVTGSKDCTVFLWMFTSRNQAIIGDNGSIEHPTPKATLTGHNSEVTCVCVLAELGMVISGSRDGPCLVHTLTGDLLRSLDPPSDTPMTAHLIAMSRETFVVIKFNQGDICNFTVNGRLQKHVKHKDNIQAMSLSRDGQYLMVGGDSGIVEVWRSHDLTLLYTYPACDSSICSLNLSHDHKFLLAGLATGCLLVFNIDFNKWHHEYQEKY